MSSVMESRLTVHLTPVLKADHSPDKGPLARRQPIVQGAATAPGAGACGPGPRRVNRTPVLPLGTGRRAAGDNLLRRVPPGGGHTAPQPGLRWRQSGRPSRSVSSGFQGRMPAAPGLGRTSRRQTAPCRRRTSRPAPRRPGAAPDAGSGRRSAGRGDARSRFRCHPAASRGARPGVIQAASLPRENPILWECHSSDSLGEQMTHPGVYIPGNKKATR
jgi:hypothetical protein